MKWVITILLFCTFGPIFSQNKEPKFKGGDCKLNRYMRKIPYPYNAIKDEIEGTVYVHFEISDSGRVQKVQIKEGVHPIVDSVALHHIQNMPDWKPGLRKGEPATYSMVIPISFGLKDPNDKRLARAIDSFEEGKALYYAGAYRDALPLLIYAIKLDPHFAEAYYIRGLCHYHIHIAMAACLDLAKAKEMGYYDERSTKVMKELDCEGVLGDE